VRHRAVPAGLPRTSTVNASAEAIDGRDAPGPTRPAAGSGGAVDLLDVRVLGAPASIIGRAPPGTYLRGLEQEDRGAGQLGAARPDLGA
jgi:hypothetical protein